MQMTGSEQAQRLTEYFENLTPKQQRRLFVVMFNELQMQEFVDCYIGEEEDQDDYGEFRAYWTNNGEDLTDGLD